MGTRGGQGQGLGQLMSEDEVRAYFIERGGIVRNDDIVSHFKHYLANPQIRDEARALFKAIVNKLATFKVENGQKLLTLKTQYFYPIDGNGNEAPTPGFDYGLPSSSSAGAFTSHPLPNTSTAFKPFPYQNPTPYISSGGFHPATIDLRSPTSEPSFYSGNFVPSSSSQQKQSQYGSQYSLSSGSTSSDPSSAKYNYNSSPADQDYGLPPAPPRQFPPKRLSFSSPTTNLSFQGSGQLQGQTARSPMIPPPYRPPPLAPVYSPPASSATTPTHTQPAQLDFPFPEINQCKRSQRSASVSGLSSPMVQVPHKIAYSASPSKENQEFFPSNNSPGSCTPGVGVPAPPVPPRTKRSASFLSSGPREDTLKMNLKPQEQSEREQSSECETYDKENNIPIPSENAPTPVQDEKVSVKERMQKFNKIASETNLKNGNSSKPSGKKESKIDNGDYDTSSISSYGYSFSHSEPKAREWILKAAKCDYPGINKMAVENPGLVKRRDINYTALHWAAKHGNVELIKLLAGTFKSSVNSKSNGGFTPLHLSAMFSRQEAYDLLVKAYNADTNLRDNSGKKPTQYLVRKDTSVSLDTFKKLKEKRRSTEAQSMSNGGSRDSFLRIGSLNVRVKKTTEAFGNFLGKSSSSSSIERVLSSKSKWGSIDSLPDGDKDKEIMPPPAGHVVPNSATGAKSRRAKLKKSILISSPIQLLNNSSSSCPSEAIDRNEYDESEGGIDSGSDSDTAAGFGSEWKGQGT